MEATPAGSGSGGRQVDLAAAFGNLLDRYQGLRRFRRSRHRTRAPAPDTASPEARDYIQRRRSGEIGGSEGTNALAGGINADRLEDPIEKIEDNTEGTVRELKRLGGIWEKISSMMPGWAEQAARKDGGGGGGGDGGGGGWWRRRRWRRRRPGRG